jgi:hypothetical protein
MHEDSPRGDTLLFLEMREITPQLVNSGHAGLSMLAFDDDGLIPPVKKDYAGPGTVKKCQLTRLQSRMNREAFLEMMGIGRDVARESFFVIEMRKQAWPLFV